MTYKTGLVINESWDIISHWNLVSKSWSWRTVFSALLTQQFKLKLTLSLLMSPKKCDEEAAPDLMTKIRSTKTDSKNISDSTQIFRWHFSLNWKKSSKTWSSRRKTQFIFTGAPCHTGRPPVDLFSPVRFTQYVKHYKDMNHFLWSHCKWLIKMTSFKVQRIVPMTRLEDELTFSRWEVWILLNLFNRRSP